MNFVAPCLFGLEGILADELKRQDIKNVVAENGRVLFSGDDRTLARANINARTAERILILVGKFKAKNFTELFENVKNLPFENFIGKYDAFPVKGWSLQSALHSIPDCQKIIKKAIVERLKEKYSLSWFEETGKKYQIQFSILKDEVSIMIDTSGEGLHKRGYRANANEAPIRETLAAAFGLIARIYPDTKLYDPFCGSGTIPIEAALIARNIAPGVFRKEFAFEKWVDFDQDLFDSIYNDESQEREFNHKIYGYDNNPKANEIATHNVKAAGLSKEIVLKLQPFQQFEQPKEKSIIITNPPYGERISTEDLLGLYKMIGERLKHAFAGNDAWILSYRDECFDQIGLKPSIKVELYNGALECQFRKYQLFDGKYKAFRQENDGKEFKPKRDDFRPRKNGERRSEGGRKFDERRGEHRFDGKRDEGRRERRFEGERKFEGKRFEGKREDRRFEGKKDFKGPRKFDRKNNQE